MSITLFYRKMTINDIPSVYLLQQRHFPHAPVLSSLYIDFLYDHRFSFVCEYNGKIYGLVFAEMNKEEVQITSLCVEKEYSGQGIGKTLLEYSIQEIKRINKTIDITLMVSSENIKAIKLYEKLGFKICNTKEKAYIDKSTGFIMKLK